MKVFAVERVFVHLHAIQHVAGKIDLLHHADPGQVLGDVALACKQQAVPVLQRRFVQIQTGILRKVRCAEQFAVCLVGPAMYRADDVLCVAAPLQHDGLTVAADVAEQFNTILVAYQHLRPALQYVVVALIRNHQLMAHVVRPLFEQQALLDFQCFGIEVPVQRRLDRNQGSELIYIGDIGHALIVDMVRGRQGLSPKLIGGATIMSAHYARCTFSNNASGSGRWSAIAIVFWVVTASRIA